MSTEESRSSQAPSRAAGIWAEGAYSRPDYDEVWVIRAEDEGVVIPWPEGVMLREAILAWSREQEGG